MVRTQQGDEALWLLLIEKACLCFLDEHCLIRPLCRHMHSAMLLEWQHRSAMPGTDLAGCMCDRGVFQLIDSNRHTVCAS